MEGTEKAVQDEWVRTRHMQEKQTGHGINCFATKKMSRFSSQIKKADFCDSRLSSPEATRIHPEVNLSIQAATSRTLLTAKLYSFRLIQLLYVCMA